MRASVTRSRLASSSARTRPSRSAMPHGGISNPSASPRRVPERRGVPKVPAILSEAPTRPDTRAFVHSGSVRLRSSAASISAVNASAESGVRPAAVPSTRALATRVAISPVAATRSSVNCALISARDNSSAVSPIARSPPARRTASRAVQLRRRRELPVAVEREVARRPCRRRSAVRIHCAGRAAMRPLEVSRLSSQRTDSTAARPPANNGLEAPERHARGAGLERGGRLQLERIGARVRERHDLAAPGVLRAIRREALLLNPGRSLRAVMSPSWLLQRSRSFRR